MSFIRSSLRTARAFCAPAIAKPSTRTFIAPSAIRLNDKTPKELEEERLIQEEYEKHRVEVEQPQFAAINEDIQFEAPTQWDPSDIGHQTIGPGHGRHVKRTLATFSMEGKVCVVTGAARGLGNMMARTFVESGASAIAIVDLNQADADAAAADLVDWFVAHGEAQPGEITAKGYGCDVADEASVAKTFDAIEQQWGKIDSLVTAAGIVENFVALEYPTEKVRKLMDINVMGNWFCAREAAKRMEKGGSIVMIGSMSGSVVNVPQPQTPYNFSKAAVRHMAASLAVEWATKGIRVNCISPGYVLTNLTKTILDANTELRDTWVNMTPMGRLADPQDLKGAVIYLASDASAFTTGSDLKIDGGYTCL